MVQQVAVAVQRGKAAAWHGQAPPPPPHVTMSLEQRRRFLIYCQMFRILHNLDCIESADYFITKTRALKRHEGYNWAERDIRLMDLGQTIETWNTSC